MTEQALDRLRAEVVYGDHPSMARLALALYEAGRGPRDVILECYGVEFPDEFFVLAEAPPRLMFHYTLPPWALARTLDRGGPPQTTVPTTPTNSLEGKIFVRDPDLVPLGWRLGEDLGAEDDDEDTGLENHFLCYRRSELATGRSAVFAIEFAADQDDPITLRAPSLLAALHRHHVANASWVVQNRRRTAGHSGGGLDDEDVQLAHQFVTIIEDVQRRLG